MDLITKLMLDITIDRPLDLPKNYYEARQLVAKLGLGAKRIDCCVNGCMLYYSNEFGVADGALLECKFCQEPRYRVTRNSRSVRRKPIPRKAMFYLPIIPRLQRLYASMQTASKMTWHRENYERRKMSGELRHPSDGMAWKHFDQAYPEFASEPRNVRLGLCSDGFTPYTQVSATPYSCWHVLVTPYNLPPDMCMSKPYMFLAAVIPGPSSPTVEEYDSYDDDDDHEDEEIADIALLAPQNELLVDRYGRPIIMPYTATDLQPQNAATKAINYALKSKFQAPYLNWTEVKADERGYQQFWNGFRSQVTWLNHHTAAIEAIFNKKATKRLSTLLFEARKKVKKDPSKPPLWLAGNSYPMLCLRWEEEEYKAKCIKNKNNRNTDEANRACVHSGGSKSAVTLRLEFIQQFGRPPTFMEMNDLMHKYADSGEWTGARAQEVSRLTQIWAEEYNASQLRLPPHRRDNEEVRRNKMPLAFVKNAGGANRGRKFAAWCTSSLYASDPTGLRDVTYTSSSSSSTGRSRPAQREETDDEYEARMRATYREEFREEYEATFDQRVDQRVQHVLQEFFAQQRAPAPAGVGSSSQGSARQNQNAGEQEYRPDLNSMVNLNQLPEYREGDPVLSMSI
ncbi:unnamed protein product [Trifolium pratense]|uniref:Uncharacterized protein n=1 Tax=Trifolium pratense TaxID=57577 RepID=A0ACB0JZE8_TRIPR|nr:unnamed protein product [Trifolium pratense]